MACGRSAPATPRRASPWPRARSGRRCSVMVIDTAPAHQGARHPAARRPIVRASYDECWQTVIEHGSERMERPLRPPVRRRSLHRRQRHRRAWRSSRICRTSTPSWPRSAAAACWPASPRRSRELRPQTRIFAAEPETAAPLAASLAAGRPCSSTDWTASFVDGAGGKSVLDTMWPLLRALDGSIVVSLDDVAARHAACGRTRARDRRRRRRLRRGRGPQRPRRGRQGRGRRLRRQHRPGDVRAARRGRVGAGDPRASRSD